VAKKLWSGRFQKGTDPMMDDFHSSISFDFRLSRYDVRGSIAHAMMLGKQGIITGKEAEMIAGGLEGILKDIESGNIDFSPEAEDIHMNIEQMLIERIGETGQKLHTARSRNDQVALDIRMFLKDEISNIIQLVKKLQVCLLELAEKHVETVMPGYTHLQRAQPVTLAHHVLAYVEMLNRDVERLRGCYKRTDILPLGAGALAGTTLPIDPDYVAGMLGFSKVAANSLDAVGSRDFAVEFNSAAALIMVNLSRFCEELILWSSAEFGFIELDDSYSTGSSMMPQKKNPDAAELIRGKTGRVFGNLLSLLTVLKGLPLAYNKDLQEDKEAIFDSVDTIKNCLSIFCPLVSTMKIKSDRMRSAANGGFVNATDLADYLAVKGVPFRKAHSLAGQIVYFCIKNQISLEDLTLAQLKEFSELIEDDVFQFIKIERCVDNRRKLGGPAPDSIRQAISQAKINLENS